jgi:hypothetical protein
MIDPAAARVWSDPDTFATCLVALALDRFGSDRPDESPLHWTVPTWVDEIRDTSGADLAPRNLDRLMAARQLLVEPDSFRTSEPFFCDVIGGIAADWFRPLVWHPTSVEETLWGLIEATLIDPPEGDTPPFSPEIVRYVNALARREGFRRLPDAFPEFGIPSDPSVWSRGPDIDYSGDPDLAPAVEEAADDRFLNLDLDTADKLRDLAARLAALPVSGDGRAVAADLERYAAGLSRRADREADAGAE